MKVIKVTVKGLKVELAGGDKTSGGSVVFELAEYSAEVPIEVALEAVGVGKAMVEGVVKAFS